MLMFSGTGKAFGYAALVRRVRSRARRRWVECRQGKESRQAPWGDKMTLPEAQRTGSLVKMRSSCNEETNAGRPCQDRDADGGLSQARDDKGPKDPAAATPNHTSFSETEKPDHSQDSSLSEDETERIPFLSLKLLTTLGLPWWRSG